MLFIEWIGDFGIKISKGIDPSVIVYDSPIVGIDRAEDDVASP